MRKEEKLLSLLERIGNTSVLCIGDIIYDKFIKGSVNRISPEAPIPVLRALKETSSLGGAGNVAANLVSLNCPTILIGTIGDDADGRSVTALLEKVSGLTAEIVLNKEQSTTTKSRFISSGQHLLRVDRESLTATSEVVTKEILGRAIAALSACDVLVVSDYGKGVVTPDLTKKLIAEAKVKSVPIVVDPNGRNYSHYRGSTVVTPNRLELSLATNMPCSSSTEILEAANFLRNKNGIESLLVTRSEEGMTLIEENNKCSHLEAEAREVFDVSGAGDTVAAVLAAALATNEKPLLAASLANIAAGIVVSKVGTAVTTKKELTDAIHTRDRKSLESKICTLESSTLVIDRWRRKGERIGFTNGAFDLLHAGHLSSIREAKSMCNRLIIGLNSDGSVRKLKGLDRPIQNENVRAHTLASLQQVDLVIIFDDETPITLLESIRPDILVKGSDYATESVVGRDFIESYGGKVVLVEFINGYSTTETIKKIRGKDN